MTKPKIEKTPEAQASIEIIADTLGQAAALFQQRGMPISVPQLKRFKRHGAPGFRHGRIYFGELLPWIKATAAQGAVPGSERESLECRRLLAQAERIEYRLGIDRGDYVHKQILADHLQRFGAEVKQVLRQKESEFPALAAGLPADQIKALFILHITDDILQKLSSHFDTWTI